MNFHAGILKARPDINSVIYTHEEAGVVISATGGQLPSISQAAAACMARSAITISKVWRRREDEVPRICADLGKGHTLIMLNHGLLSVGASLGEAFGFMRTLIDECRLVETRARHRPEAHADSG